MNVTRPSDTLSLEGWIRFSLDKWSFSKHYQTEVRLLTRATSAV